MSKNIVHTVQCVHLSGLASDDGLMKVMGALERRQTVARSVSLGYPGFCSRRVNLTSLSDSGGSDVCSECDTWWKYEAC